MTYRTEVCPKSLNPAWPAQWFTFEVDNETLQDEPLQIRYVISLCVCRITSILANIMSAYLWTQRLKSKLFVCRVQN